MKKNKGKLYKSLIYLAGPIQFTSDEGKGWRALLKSLCKKKKIYINWLDPTDKLDGLKKEVGEEQNSIKRLKKEKKWDELSRFIKPIVRSDLRCCDLSDALIVYIDTSIHSCGTYHELITSLNQKKPVLAIINGGKGMAPDWLFGILDYNMMFETVEECVDYLDKINRHEIEGSDRWVLIRKQLDGIKF